MVRLRSGTREQARVRGWGTRGPVGFGFHACRRTEAQPGGSVHVLGSPRAALPGVCSTDPPLCLIESVLRGFPGTFLLDLIGWRPKNHALCCGQEAVYLFDRDRARASAKETALDQEGVGQIDV
jgi:hypothetical protein